jgi:ABC-2 type transport system permease protein
MNNLIKTEWLKIKNYTAFWWLMGVTALSYPGINYMFYSIYQKILEGKGEVNQAAKFFIGNPFSFPEAWHTVAYFSSYFVFIPAVVVIMFITNEYTFKTHRQNIIDGWSRNQFMASKLIDVVIISIIVTVLLTIIALVVGVINTSDVAGNILDMIYYVGLFALQTFSQLSLAFMVGFLIRKAFISLGIFLFYFIILEPILVKILSYKYEGLGRFLPLAISNRMIPVPAFLAKFGKDAYDKNIADIPLFVILTILLTTLVWFLCFRINNKRDL